jgi:hypothetical protein
MPAVTFDRLDDYVWRRLGPRRVLAGRKTVRDLVQLAIENWPAEMLNHCREDNERQVVVAEVVRSMKRLHMATAPDDNKTMGILWLFLLQAVASAVVQLVLKWWLESASNRVFLVAWRKDLTA